MINTKIKSIEIDIETPGPIDGETLEEKIISQDMGINSLRGRIKDSNENVFFTTKFIFFNYGDNFWNEQSAKKWIRKYGWKVQK